MKLRWKWIVFAGSVSLVAGCAQLGYYMQAMQGQFSLMADARPIEDWLADPGVEEKLKFKLTKVKQIRKFAANELGLPDNDTFKNYTDLKRPYVLWNVVATPELSLKPLQWCFPIAGCVNYRGYYSKEEAKAFAAELREEGYDVQVSGVPAYSTLGWFSDPVLSTFIQYPEGQLAKLVFHELAHQVAYAKDDSKFNESFAVAVEEVGIERWLEKYGDPKTREAYMEHEGRRKNFLALLMKYRKQLELNYERQASRAEKRQHKKLVFEAMKDEYEILKESWGGYAGYDRWFAEPLSNAHLSSIATYHDLVPGFKAMLMREQDFGKFYAAVRTLSALDKESRHSRLAQFARTHSMTAQADAADASR
ncbi:aminopeptidase [Oxalobacteraceae bacterium R-40]|uniref:Aminopeptidase n=1 Tax=Keguizhuia sedimenti TaxID=3064264 RepID=A0ABU1BQS1_9BURK|nr:aminopeptidase [Oxalobacteraceae bacterium R-40]